MDSSNMGVETTGDIEVQHSNPSWVAAHKHMLRPNQEAQVNKLGYFILKVPEYVQQSSKAFSPIGWRFGLHNRENLDSNGSEAIKLGVARQYGLVGEQWDHFCDAIVDDPKDMLACYDLQNGVSGWTNEHIKHVLALDALFLAFFIDKNPPHFSRGLLPKCNMMSSQFDGDNVFQTRYDNWGSCIYNDLFRVENQVPLVLIYKVADYFINYDPFFTSQDNEFNTHDFEIQKQKSIINLILNVANNCIDISFNVLKSDLLSAFDVKTHILGATYDVICGCKGSSIWDSSEKYISIPSATKLEQSGIKIVGIEEALCKMSCEDEYLSLPKMKMYDDTPSYIRNMAYYESKNKRRCCLFRDYIFLIMDLIKAPEDVDLLIECGVIENGCGMSTFGMWKTLDEGLPMGSSSIECNVIRKNISSRCKLRRYRLWSEFQIVFCSRPWFVLSTIAIILVTMATLVQTYISIIGSNKMKPKFP